MNTFEKEFTAAAPKYGYLLRFFHDALQQKEVQWKHITIRNLTKVREQMESECAANSVVTYCAVIKAVLAQFADTDLIPCGDDYKKALKPKSTPSEQVALTEEEIAQIERYIPKSKTEREVKAQFLCEYYSLARASDIANFKRENIDIENGYITYTAVKTKKTAIVPLHKNFLKYFAERGDIHQRWVYNTTIKRIAQKCGICKSVRLFYRGQERTAPKYELIGSHTARRSAATNLAKRGTPIAIIAKMMSHGQDIKMTQRYIWVDEIKLDDQAAAFFR